MVVIGGGGGPSVTFTSKWTGSFGNSITVSLAAGSQVGTWKVIVAAPGLIPEVFDNIGLGLAGVAFWTAVANAINSGTNVLRGASQIIVATVGSTGAAPTAQTVALAGGTDGATTITGATLVGQDTVPRSGLYALRNTGASIALLADCDDSTTYAAQVAYGLSEGTYMMLVTPSGDAIANAVAVKASAGIDSYAAKLILGDWVYWLDTYNALLRVVSPQGFIGGLLSALSPEQSSLNKRLNGVAGTQKSNARQQYSAAELQMLGSAGIDVIANPSPGGAYFSARFGHNTSSNRVINGDTYTRMTNYLAYTLDAGMGKFVGLPQTATLRSQAAATISAFLDNLQAQNMIGDPNGGPAYSVQLNAANNPASQVALGYMQAYVKVKYLAIVEDFLVSLEGGASVQIQRGGVQLT